MTPFQDITAAVAGIVLFLYGLQRFSSELQTVGGEELKSWLTRVTASRWSGFLIGALATAILQSSSAVTSLAVSLVDQTIPRARTRRAHFSRSFLRSEKILLQKGAILRNAVLIPNG